MAQPPPHLSEDPPQPLYPAPMQEYAERLSALRAELLASSPPAHGLADTDAHLRAIAAAVPRAREPTYFGFVTGGVTPAAQRADELASRLDANVSVHLPDVSVATVVEDTALRWLLDMLRLDPRRWALRTCTTGATASNVLGLACGRDWVVREAAARRRSRLPGAGGDVDASVARDGLAEALRRVGVRGVRVIAADPHSSLRKAASIVGLGHDAVVEAGQASVMPALMDNARVSQLLADRNFLNIVVVSAGEINTGFFGTNPKSFEEIRQLCNQYGAWLHVDAAFGLMARLLDPKEFFHLSQGVHGLETADSIAGDAHKLLNIPYDCGLFFSRHPDISVEVFKNPGAPYLSSGGGEQHGILSPLNIGIENSRRFRALPLYASLRTYGKEGYTEMLKRQILTARLIARWIRESPYYVLLPDYLDQPDDDLGRVDNLGQIFIIVLFKAKDARLNEHLVSRINATGQIYVSGTIWEGTSATRIAVANWKVDPERESSTVARVLSIIAEST